jgi:hypothetical protein
MLPRKTVSYLLVALAMLTAFGLGHTAFAQSYACRYDTRCTHAVSYCTALYPCNNFGFTCWEESASVATAHPAPARRIFAAMTATPVDRAAGAVELN